MGMKVTFFFRQAQSGWTESLYNDGGGHAAVLLLARGMAVKRMGLCGAPVEMPYIRVSEMDVRGDVALDKNPGFSTRTPAQGALGGLIRVVPAEPTSADMSWTSLLVNLSHASIARGRIFMRGLPDVFFSGPTGWTPNAAWRTAFDEWETEFHFAANGWGLYRKPQSNPANTFKIKSAVSAANTDMVITIPVGFAVALTNLVQIRGMESDRGKFSGIFEVTGVTATTVTISKQFGFPQPLWTVNKGTIQVYTPTFLPECHANYRGTTTRHVGGPFGQPVGRRKRVLQVR